MISYLSNNTNFHGIWALRKTANLQMNSQCQKESAIYDCWNIKHLLCSIFFFYILFCYQFFLYIRCKSRDFQIFLLPTFEEKCLSSENHTYGSFSCFTKRVAQNLFWNCLIGLGIRVSCVAWETALGKTK